MKNLYTNLLILFFLTGMGSRALAQDAGVIKLLSPKDLSCGSTADVIVAVVYNYGSSAITNIPCVASCTGTATFTLKDTLKKTIAAGKQDTIIFKTTVNTYSGGTYKYKIYSNLSSDTKRSNDTLALNITAMPFPATPTVTNSKSCGLGPVKFIAVSTTKGAKTYWFPSSTSNTVLAKGDTFTQKISATTTYYAQSLQGSGYDSLATLFTAGNGQTGNMFDVDAYKTLNIDSFDVSPQSSGADSVDFYYKLGTYTTNQFTASAWTYVGKCNIYCKSSGSGTKARAVFPQITLKAGNKYAFYIRLKGSNILNYTNGSSTDSFSNSSMTIHAGDGMSGLFGGNFSIRKWNGTIYYSTPTCSSARVAVTGTVATPVQGVKLSFNKTSKGSMNAGNISNPDQICVGDSLKFDVSTPTNYTNADYGTKWKLTYSMVTSKNSATTNYTVTSPSSSVKGAFAFVPKSTDGDSTYMLRVVATNLATSCDSLFTRYVHVNQTVNSSFSVSNACFGLALPVTNKSTSKDPIQYIWYFGNGDSATDAAPKYKYKGSGSYSITLKAYNPGCSSTSTGSVTIYNAAYGSNILKGSPYKGAFNTGDVIDPDNVCLGDTNTYQITPPKGLSNSDFGSKWVVTSLSFQTAFGHTSKDTATKLPTSSKNGTFTFFPTSDFDSVFILKISLRTLPGNCDSMLIRYIHVRVKPVAGFKFTNACLGSALSFKDTSSIKVSTISNWAWDFGDGNTSNAQNPSHSYSKAGSYTAKLTAISDAGCASSTTRTVQEYPRAVVKFGTKNGCNGDNTAFTDSSTLATGSLAAWKWTTGDGGSLSGKTASYVYAKSGFYNVKLVTTTDNGCKDSLTRKIRILAKPVAVFTYLNACVGSDIFFGNTSIDSLTGSTYLWKFGDKTSSAALAPSHKYTSNGTDTVVLKITSKSGCYDTAFKAVTPFPKPDVKFGFIPGCTGQSIVFADSSNSGTGSLFDWSFGDGGTTTTKAVTASHSFKKAGTYKIRLAITNNGGCIDSLSKSITIINPPKGGFTAADVCVGKTTVFTNTSTGDGTLNYKWTFGDNTAANITASPTHKYTLPGSYGVKLAVTNNNGCSDTFTNYVNVHALPVAPVWVRNQTGYKVTFVPQDTSLAGYVWYFGTTTNDSSAKKVPTFTYPTADAKYGVKLVVTNKSGCVASRIDSIGMGIYGVDEQPVSMGSVTVYPNPFEGSTVISYSLARQSHVNIRVYDIEGKEVAVLKDGTYGAGLYKDTFDAAKYKAGAGVYFIRMYVDDRYYAARVLNLK